MSGGLGVASSAYRPLALLVCLAVLSVLPTYLWPGDDATLGSVTGCTWQPLPVDLPARYQAAGVYDPSSHRLYVYGGLDREGDACSDYNYVDLSSDELASATVTAVEVDGLQPEPRWAHAGVFRFTGDGEPSLLWIAGQRNQRSEPEPTPTGTRPTGAPT